MTATVKQTFRPSQGPIEERAKGNQERSILGSGTNRKLVKRRLSTAAMVIGYLGLVAMLSMAPALHQTMATASDSIHACTDFGGSR